jgi:hypothetical protein
MRYLAAFIGVLVVAPAVAQAASAEGAGLRSCGQFAKDYQQARLWQRRLILVAPKAFYQASMPQPEVFRIRRAFYPAFLLMAKGLSFARTATGTRWPNTPMPSWSYILSFRHCWTRQHARRAIG